MRFCYIMLAIFLFQPSSSYSLVYSNHGPAFLAQRSYFGELKQGALLTAYVGWNSLHLTINEARKRSILYQASKTYFKPVLLNHNSLENNDLRFGYKEGAHDYFDWEFVSTSYGYCHGMTIVTRNFLYFAKFNPDKKAPYDYNKNLEEWLAYYEDLIDQVMKNKVTEIPGFHNLSEFSESKILNYLQRHVADQWGINTAKISMYLNVYDHNFKSIENGESLFKLKNKLNFYLSQGYYPRLVIAKDGFADVTDPHVVMITKIESVNEKCLKATIFNVGTRAGGKIQDTNICINDHAIIPSDEFIYFEDFANQLSK